MGLVVVVRDLEGVPEERLGVTPVAHLTRAQDDAHDTDGDRGHAEHDLAVAPAAEGVRRAPGGDDGEAHLRHVGVAIGHRHRADLHEADDG